LQPGGKILINTRRPQSEFKELQPFTLGIVDAHTVSERQGLGRTINTAMLGAYGRFSGKPALEILLASIEEMVPAKKKANLEAARQAYEQLETR
jgi:pyruvate ferredoxin oxidoreductase gamma subunit